MAAHGIKSDIVVHVSYPSRANNEESGIHLGELDTASHPTAINEVEKMAPPFLAKQDMGYKQFIRLLAMAPWKSSGLCLLQTQISTVRICTGASHSLHIGLSRST